MSGIQTKEKPREQTHTPSLVVRAVRRATMIFGWAWRIRQQQRHGHAAGVERTAERRVKREDDAERDRIWRLREAQVEQWMASDRCARCGTSLLGRPAHYALDPYLKHHCYPCGDHLSKVANWL